MTTPLVQRPEFTVDEALRIADQNAASYEDVASVSRTLAAEVRRLQAAEARAGREAKVAFYVRPGLVETCRQIAPVQKEHRVIVATQPTAAHTVPLYTTPSRAGGGEVGDGSQ